MLDLVGAAGDRLGGHADEHLGDDAVEQRSAAGRGAGEHAVGRRCRAGDGAGGELAERALGAGDAAGGTGGLGAAGRPVVGPLQGDERGDALAGDGIVAAAGERRRLDDEVGTPSTLRVPRVGGEVLVGLGRSLADGTAGGDVEPPPAQRGEAPLVGERRHGDTPALTRLADDVLGGHDVRR